MRRLDVDAFFRRGINPCSSAFPTRKYERVNIRPIYHTHLKIDIRRCNRDRPPLLRQRVDLMHYELIFYGGAGCIDPHQMGMEAQHFAAFVRLVRNILSVSDQSGQFALRNECRLSGTNC
jgi:hypothetical protein